MMSFRRRGMYLAAAVASMLAAVPQAIAAEPAQTFGCSQADGARVGAELKVGDMVSDDGAGAAVQPPGMTVTANVLMRTGSATLTVRTEDDGTVVVDGCGDDSAPEAKEAPLEGVGKRPLARASALGECVDYSYGWPFGYRWYWPYAWYLKTDTVPAGLSEANVANAIIEGTQSITGARNKCGMIDDVPAQQRYDGPTNGWANISGDYCLATDWHNVADFAGGSPATLAVTCTWEYNGSDAAGSSDMRFNDAYNDWMPDGSGSCGGYRYVIRSVTAHERGHTFGLGHVNESTHGNLTMSTQIAPCSDQEFWLGRGDVLGLRARYPF